MSGVLTFDEIVRGLTAKGVPIRLAQMTAAQELGMQAHAEPPAVQELPKIQFPVCLTLPWSSLISDNCRHGVINGHLLLTSDYRRCKGLVREHARAKVQGEPVAVPLSLEARVWVPDNTRAHDVCNFAKAVHDALETVIYTKDRWLYDVHWIRAGVDVDAPRAEITISPLIYHDGKN